MKKNTLLLATGLIGLSVVLHFVHFLIFQDLHHLVIYLFGDIAFIPLEVFFVSLVIDKFIERREKDQLLSKVNMLIGLFYQEIGSSLLGNVIKSDSQINRDAARVDSSWQKEDYLKLKYYITDYNFHIAISKVDFNTLLSLIDKKQDLIINLITNQAIQENEQFTESLMSVFHLLEELKQRNLDNLEQGDINHLKVDIERVYKSLAMGWVNYLTYLKKDYPYLFVSALRTNPFGDPQIS